MDEINLPNEIKEEISILPRNKKESPCLQAVG
jgi:hypothetical protein